jgi:hypothetical protein
MKKMILALAVVACTAVAQAITFSWQTSSANAWYDSTWSCTLIHSDAATPLADAAAVAVAQTATAGYTIVANGSEGFSIFEPGAYNKGYITSNDGDYTAATAGTYFLIFNKGMDYYASSINAEDAENAWTGTAGGSTVGEFVTIPGFTSGTVVPEPTALALLALGVAGLALRRKMA